MKKTSVSLSMFWNTIGNIYYLMALWLFSVIIMRTISGESNLQYSHLLTLSGNISSIVFTFSTFGMRNFQVSDLNEKYPNGTYIYSRYITSIIAFVACAIFLFLNNYSVTAIICCIIYVLFRLSEVIFDVYAGIFQKMWRMDLVGKSLIIRGTLIIISFTSILITTQNLIFAFSGITICAFLSLLFFDYQQLKRLTDVRCIFDNKKLISLLKECLPLAAYMLLLSLIAVIPRQFLEYFQNDEISLGIYGNISSPTLIVQTVTSQLFVPLISLLSEAHQQKNYPTFWQLIKKCMLMTVGIAVIALIGVSVLGEWGLNFLYHSEAINAHAYLLIPLTFTTIITAFVWFLCGVLTVLRNSKALLISNVIATIICIPISYYFTKNFAFNGAAYAAAITLLIDAVLLFYFLLRSLKKQQ
jgi:hypothetical protein